MRPSSLRDYLVYLLVLLFALPACRFAGSLTSRQPEAVSGSAATSEIEPSPTAAPQTTPSARPPAGYYTSPTLGISLGYPDGWYLRKGLDTSPYDLLLATFDPASPPHKLEWDTQTTSLALVALPVDSLPPELDSWVASARQAAADSQLQLFSEQRLQIARLLPAARLTLVSGSGGIIDQVLLFIDGRPFEIQVQGNFELARLVLDTLQPAGSLKPPDADSPVAGICGRAETPIVEIALTDDGPAMPRCSQLSAEQRILLVNGKSSPVQLSFAHFAIDLQPGELMLLDQPVGEYLAPGIHFLDGAELILLGAAGAQDGNPRAHDFIQL